MSQTKIPPELENLSYEEMFNFPQTPIEMKDIKEGDVIFVREDHEPDTFYFIPVIENREPERFTAPHSWCLFYDPPPIAEWQDCGEGNWILDESAQLYHICWQGIRTKNEIQLDRKDFCHQCQNDKLVWKMMAGFCAICGKHLIG